MPRASAAVVSEPVTEMNFRASPSVDTRYTMNGSALRGDMRGGAEPAEITVRVPGLPGSLGRDLLEDARLASPACAALRDPLAARFALTYNGRPEPLGDLGPSPATVCDPSIDFDRIVLAARPGPAIIRKVAEAKVEHGVRGGAGSSLQPEQRRTLHVRADARLTAHGEPLRSVVSLVQPIGSAFEFACDPRGVAAPAPLAYLSAGLAFCLLTQIGRYAAITRQRPYDVRLAQRMQLDEPPAPVAAGAPATHVFLEGAEPANLARQTIGMAAQTCFVHAALRDARPPRLALEVA